jgi:hypothetical protein
MTRAHCPFRKTILGGSCQCSRAAMSHLPTGCSVTCASLDAFGQCEQFLDHLINAAQFALHYVDGTDSLTHGKLMKVQHGGLLGLQMLIEESEQAVGDIHGLLNTAVARYGGIEDIPAELLLPYIKAHQNKRRKKD